MEPALDVLHRALHGDEGARSFLDRTSSIYVLDATDPAKPRTYGCWNFIHQAMNEVERAEGNLHRQTFQLQQQQQQQQQQPVQPQMQFVAHVQLLATMALRVARRSNTLDKQLVATCVMNAAQYNASAREAQTLIDINVEIRDIVMGRLAALALDPSFLRTNSASNYSSVFSDTVVLETFCAVLAANAVSNGPAAVKHLVSEWIVPSSNSLPPFCLSCITLHLAEEAARRTAPVGTHEALQQLSTLVMAGVAAPVLAESINESNPDSATNKDAALSNGLSMHELNCRIAALCLRAMNRWCAVTDLSLAQIKHICGKVKINIVDVLNNAMYSDSPAVVDALAEFIESVMERHQILEVSIPRMTQVRYIMQVDEASFRSSITPEQLLTIESKEMALILEELVSAVGLQRFRFADRQASGDHGVCRNLARIGASVCDACGMVDAEGNTQKVGHGLLDLLLKAASHPSYDISGIGLEALAKRVSSETGIVHQLLPILQGRAIAPHHFVTGNIPTLGSNDPSFEVDFGEFEAFRDTVLAECLVACCKAQMETYMASCTAAVEEFCGPGANGHVSFHLEAALFCIGAVAEEEGNETGEAATVFSSHLIKCLAALSSKPDSLLSNPLTLARACCFIQKYHKFYGSNPGGNCLDMATDLALSTFSLCASSFPNEPAAIEMYREASVSPYSDAAKSLELLLCQSPHHFLSTHAIAALGAGWEASYAAANRRGVLSLDDRKSICVGISHVLATLPDSQRAKSLLALAMPTLDCLETMLREANQTVLTKNSTNLDLILDRLASEIVLVSAMSRSFTDAYSIEHTGMESGSETSNVPVGVAEPALSLLKRAWPSVASVATTTQFWYKESVANAVGQFLCDSLPLACHDDLSILLLQELCQMANSIIQSRESDEGEWIFGPLMDFLQYFSRKHGGIVDKVARSTLLNSSSDPEGRESGVENGGDATFIERGREVGKCLETLLLSTVAGVQNLLGSSWTGGPRQGNGESAFESDSEQKVPKESSNGVSMAPSSALGPLLSVLRTCADHCPIFLVHLPAAPNHDRNEDPMLLHAVEAAVASILVPDVATSKNAMEFLCSIVRLYLESGALSSTTGMASNASGSMVAGRQTIEHALAPIRVRLVSTLLVGCCGKIGTSTLLEIAADLLDAVLQTYDATTSSSPDQRQFDECRMILAQQGLSSEHFLLGNQAKEVVLNRLLQCCRIGGGGSGGEKLPLFELLQDIWRLHQVESADALENSESVAWFCRRYRS